MGIQGLLPFLKKIQKPVNVSQFKGCTVAIDAYCWLHRGAFACADKLALGEKTDMYVYYCMKYVDYMLKCDIKPILVFDGCHLPSKKDVEKTRRERRELNRKKAAEFLRQGRRGEARECLQKCIDITPQMALELMNVCRERDVDCIVAPYEADAQLAYLNKSGIAQVIITEDSDLLLFGSEKVIFKMDHQGNGMLIEKKDINQVLDIQQGFYTFDKFRHMCILSGCDYLASLPGIGLATACKVFKKARLTDIRMLLRKLSSYLKKTVNVTSDYIENFVKAENTFLYQLCFDPINRKMVPLNDYPPELATEEMNYAGSYIAEEKALQISLGNVDIYTGQQINNYNPNTFKPKNPKKKSTSLHMQSIWDPNYRIRPKISLHEIQLPDKPSLAGKEKTIHLPKKPQVKRPRDNDDYLVADGKLADVYDESPAKRHRTDEVTTREESEDKQNSDSDRLFIKCQSPDKKKLTAADFCSISMEEEKEEKENDAKPKVSPHRVNKFAVNSLKKEKFDLNSKKVNVLMKSRFFAGSSDKQKENKVFEIKAEPIEHEEENGSLKIKTEPQEDKHLTLNIKVEPKDDFTDNKRLSSRLPDLPKVPAGLSIPTSTHTSTPHPKKKSSKILAKSSSQSSAFSWSKFKFSKSKSSENISSPPTSSSVNSAFQSVVKKEKEDNAKVDEEDVDFKPSQKLCKTESQASLCSLASLTSASQTSNPYSVESDCLPCSQEIEDLEKEQRDNYENKDASFDGKCEDIESTSIVSKEPETSAPNSVESSNENSSTFDKSLPDCDSTDDSFFKTKTQLARGTLGQSKYFSKSRNSTTEDVIVIDEDSQNSKSIPPVKPRTVKKECRVSGLSKSSRRNGGTAGKVSDIGQTKIKDLFARFSKKSTSFKDDDELGNIEMTPESHSSNNRSKLSGVQRKLLP